MGQGIAAGFKRKFGRVQELKEQNRKIGQVAHVEYETGKYIFYLITKEKYYQKPSYEDLDTCLFELTCLCGQLGIKDIHIPRLGCGLDGLNWSRVRNIVRRRFRDTETNVIVYTL
ncbi:hypothetical protein ONE63_007289 [Megalurothrips usitatus]|uniref:Macro domain-containing protein n=1 Tax=Megalurothrips usitatus TaxID=439358 RepID=A0AAV7XRJ6_9NEOP|nr:hypothetical protein ONE63_007289 [Megalurothrips usitatus]